MIKIEHLKKSYPAGTPLEDVNAVIHRGDVISVIGPSGTGKSTLLRCINLLEEPTAGKITIDGEEITAPGCQVNLIRQKMGMVFQSFNLFSNMTAVENIMYAPMKLKGLTKQEAYDRAIELLKLVRLPDRAMSFPDELSGGQKQRVAIARTLAMEPEIILFDEPTSALDPTMVGEVQQVISKLKDRGMTMLIVTHEMKFARAIANRVFYMDHGGIYEDGTPDQVFDHPKRERTRAFMEKLQVLEKDVQKETFDYFGFSGEAEAFARNHDFSGRGTNRLLAVLEEFGVNTLLPSLQKDTKVKLLLQYSKEKEECRVVWLVYGNPDQGFGSLLEKMDPLAKEILKNAVTDMNCSSEEGRFRYAFSLRAD